MILQISTQFCTLAHLKKHCRFTNPNNWNCLVFLFCASIKWSWRKHNTLSITYLMSHNHILGYLTTSLVLQTNFDKYVDLTVSLGFYLHDYHVKLLTDPQVINYHMWTTDLTYKIPVTSCIAILISDYHLLPTWYFKSAYTPTMHMVT